MAISRCRWLPTISGEGAWNMAADEVLLEAAHAGTASFRLYGWQRPTLSLGYFQPASVRASDPRLACLPWLRRATGGSALVHDQELTYSLALPVGEPWQRKGQSWLRRMHTILAQALARLNIVTEAVPEGEDRKLGEVLCFLHQTAGDLRIAGHKVVGSAQRKQRGALLQHGAILLAKSAATPALPGIGELVPTSQVDSAQLAQHIVTTFTEATGWHFEASGWQLAEEARIAYLVNEKYGADGWNRKR